MRCLSLEICLVALATGSIAVDAIVRVPQFPTSKGTKALTEEVLQTIRHSVSGSTALDWLEWTDLDGHEDGYRIYQSSDKKLLVENVVSGAQRTVLEPPQIPRNATGFSLNVNKSRAIWATNATKGYRYSYYANYQVQDIATGNTVPLDPKQNADVQYAVWSPSDPNVIAFVRQNNIYLWTNGVITAVTTDGSPELFHGVPDWIYEEEVIEGRYTLWFSPDGEFLAFLSFDDSEVPTYTVPYYMNNKKIPPTYPRELKIKYPKVGSPNPYVKASVYSLKSSSKPIDIPTSSAFAAKDLVIGEVAWLTNTHEKLIIRCFNRVQNLDKHLLYEVSSQAVKVVRQRDGTDGWLDNTRAIKWIGQLPGVSSPRARSFQNTTSSEGYYLDLSDQDGWQHLYQYSTEGGPPKQLTSGNWEIRNLVAVDKVRGTAIFTSTEVHPTESHAYTLSLATGVKQELQPARSTGFWDISVSPRNEYFVLSYAGPNTPFQQLYSFASPQTPIKTLVSNENLIRTLEQFALPSVTYYDLMHPSGFNLSAKMILPASFSPDKQYPVLLTPYGGPGSQEVTKESGLLTRSLFAVTEPKLEYITYTVDNRGTGFRGRAFRNFFSRAMGVVDVEDQVWAAAALAKEPYVDKNRIGMWGWSNGGHLTAKVIERNSGVFSFGISTAPTTDSRLYDSIFMERYLGLPQDNQSVYDNAAVRNPTGFKNLAGSFLIQHGTGDDNVHFQHSAVLVDMLMGAGVPPNKFTAQFFTDSDHNIRYNGGGAYQSAQLKKMLLDEKARVITVNETDSNTAQEQEDRVRFAELPQGEIDLGLSNKLRDFGAMGKNKGV